MTIPTDDELDAAVTRLEPRLFMTLGARSRRRRVARILSGTAAGAGLIAAGLAIGVYLVPPPASSPVAAPGPASTVPTSPTTKGPVTAGPINPPLSTIVCHDADGTVLARLQVDSQGKTASALCASVTAGSVRTPLGAIEYGATCTGNDGTTDVYVARSAEARSLCAQHGTTANTGTK